jgi:HD-GYP domain-containing protein (c-di-GMP phosphodiesterase class II)
MAYVEIDDDLYNSFDDEVKSKLKPYQPEDVSALKENANKILQEKKALEAKYAEAQAEFKKSKVVNHGKESEDANAKLEDALSKLNEANKRLEEQASAVRKDKIHTEALRIGTELAPTDARRAKLLAKEAAARLDLSDNGFTVLDESGKPTISQVGELKSMLSAQFDFLVDGSKASGGGATGGSGGAAKTNTVKRSDFDSMDQKQRSDFAKSGGKVVND